MAALGQLVGLAERVSVPLAQELERELRGVYEDQALRAAAVLVGVCYPALRPAVRRHASDMMRIVDDELATPRSRARFEQLGREELGAELDAERVRRGLRVFARRERLRIALRELLPRDMGGADVDVTSKELAYLADVTLELALEEAIVWAARRYGDAVRTDGGASRFVVLGMGKLGGEELNAGSDIDLIYFYDTDEGSVVRRGAGDTAPASMTLHEYWQRVAKRLTATIEDVTEDGAVWRVDLRLRPEGGAGPLVMSLASAERYYESFGRLWERAALLRARPVAGSLAFGDELLEALSPFVWRRRIDPSIALELVRLVQRGRTELSQNPARDLKLGPGGIREAEFFVQALQLVWGGRDPALRVRPTLAALFELETKGLCTQLEAVDISDGYLALRRAEHAVQNSSGIQTHELPVGEDLERIARMLGFADGAALETRLGAYRDAVGRRFASLLPDGQGEDEERWGHVLGPLERSDAQGLFEALRPRLTATDEAVLAFAANLVALGGHPDSLLGVRTRESFPGLAETLLEALFEAADPYQAARYLRVFFDRVRQPAVYVRLVFSDPAALRRLIGVLGASAFIGDALSNNPELGDMILFSRDILTEEAVRREVLACLQLKLSPDEDPEEAFVGALRLAKTRVTLEVALGDLSDRFNVREVNRLLSALADASLEAATQRALGGAGSGLAVIAMGKLGGREISYGSDLDVLFVYDPERAPDPSDAAPHFTRAARKVIRYISTMHGAGPGYDLDTRLRPSGNQGLLVTSLEAFAKYHGHALNPDQPPPSVVRRAAVWERMALVRGRAAAGDLELGARACELALSAAYGEPPDVRAAASEMARIRERVEREGAREREGFYDLKLGRGGLLEIEFIVQFSQITHGASLPSSARTGDTAAAIEALASAEVLESGRARVLAEAYAFLRRLELRVRVLRADASHVLDTHSPTLVPLARRMKMREHPSRSATQALIDRYLSVTDGVRAIYEETFFLAATRS